jgi:hypothetical protein
MIRILYALLVFEWKKSVDGDKNNHIKHHVNTVAIPSRVMYS